MPDGYDPATCQSRQRHHQSAPIWLRPRIDWRILLVDDEPTQLADHGPPAEARRLRSKTAGNGREAGEARSPAISS